jgi:transcription antitermination factor NusG
MREEMAPPEKFQFEGEDEAMEFIEGEDGLTGVHEMDGYWMPGDTHAEFNEWHESQKSENGQAPAYEGVMASDAEELEDYEMHTPNWSGTTEKSWNSPDLEDFDTDDLSEVDDHFFISSSGFPPENFTDLKLPVVEPNGELSLNALAAVKGGRGVTAVKGLESQMEEEIVDVVNSIANDEFDLDWGNGEEENTEADAHAISGTAGRPTPGENTVGGVRVLSGDDLQQGYKSGESDADSLTRYKVINMTENIEDKLSELSEPVAVEAEEVDELREKANRFEEMSENLEALRERTDILDEVDRSQVEELAESGDAVVVESGRYEELQAEADQVKGVYATSLAEEYPAFTAEELSEKFGIEELREKFEEEIGDVEEELTSSETAEPRSQDADEESLEKASETDDEAEELSDEVQQKQDEIRDKILGGS